MIKELPVVLAGFALLGVASLQAQPVVSISQEGVFPSGNEYFVFHIAPNGAVFDEIEMSFSALGNTQFLGENDTFQIFAPPGTEENTDFLLQNFVYLGWAGLTDIDSPTSFQGSLAALAMLIDQPIEFAQIAATPAPEVSVHFQFSYEDFVIGTQSLQIPVPEPASSTLVLWGLCFVGRRRRL